MQHVLTGTGGQQASAVDMSYEEFREGNFYWCQDFTCAKRSHDSDVEHEITKGTLRLDIRFEFPITEPVYVFIISEYPARMTVYPSRQVLLHQIQAIS